MLEYQIPMTNLLLSEVFHKLEILRQTNTIEDYSVTQTTLDQVQLRYIFVYLIRLTLFSVWYASQFRETVV